jgi:precorrin-6A/cobalt-precorrin-6A reductase
MPAPKLLILGGTAEARGLARAAIDRFADKLDVITSLAGRTRNPAALPGQVRVGGFGGAAGLAGYLSAEAIAMVIDATHPFATVISDHARQASERAGVPRLALLRPRWRKQPGDNWIEVDNVAGAVTALADHGGRAFITVGVKDLDAFAGAHGIAHGVAHGVVRLVDRPVAPPAEFEILTGRGPFTVAGETRLLTDHGIDVVVSKASGGAATRAKITAARKLGIPVIMIRRPPGPPGPRTSRRAVALDWIAERLLS